MSLIQGRSFRVGSPFPGAENERRGIRRTPRSRYDTGIRRRFIIAGFSKESSLADNTLFLTAREFPSAHPRKIPGKQQRDRESRAGPQLAATAGFSAALLHYETHFRITRRRDAKRPVGTSRSVINSQSDLRLSRNADVILRQDRGGPLPI